jgi:hypothetical protein
LGGRAAGTAAALPSYTLVSSAAGTTNCSAPWHAEFSFHPRREWSGRGCDPLPNSAAITAAVSFVVRLPQFNLDSSRSVSAYWRRVAPRTHCEGQCSMPVVTLTHSAAPYLRWTPGSGGSPCRRSMTTPSGHATPRARQCGVRRSSTLAGLVLARTRKVRLRHQPGLARKQGLRMAERQGAPLSS